MKRIKTFEQFSQELDESFLGFKNEEEKKEDLITKTKAVLKYFMRKKSVRNYKYWFDLIQNKDLISMSEPIKNKFNSLKNSRGSHTFGGANGVSGGFASDIIKNINKDSNIYDDEIADKIKEWAPKFNLDPEIICKKINLTC